MGLSVEEAGEVDPRRARSRARLVEATIALLQSGGVQAVTVDAVARASGVARTTLYRHFPNADALLAAAFVELIPKVEAPPRQGTLKQQLTELLTSQARLIEQAPMQLTGVAWLAVMQRSAGESGADAETLRDSIVNRYRRAFDDVLSSAAARAELGTIDIDLAIAQLVGPLAFARLVGLESVGSQHCEQIVEDFFACRSARGPSPG